VVSFALLLRDEDQVRTKLQAEGWSKRRRL
jgi:hypothetical protein